MLSAVENFGGPLVGPSVALSHHPHAVHHLQAAQHHQHINTTAQHHERGGIGYALDIIDSEGSVRVSAAATPTSATSIPTSTIISAQVPLTPNQLTQLNALQALKLQQLHQQYEQQLSNFLSASTVSSQPSTAIGGGVTVSLPHRPQPQVASTLSDEQQQRQQQQQHHYNLQHQYQQQQEHQQHQRLQREQQSNSVNLTLTPANAPKYMSSPRDTSAMMPLTEFTQPPKPKHEQQRTVKENGQCGAINLVTTSSNTFPSTTNPYQLNSASSSNSNPAFIDNSRPSSTSSSVDVENDESMSPVTTNGRKLFDPAALLPGNAPLKQPTYSETSASSAAAAVVAAYQYNYAHLYGAGGGGSGRPVTGLYNAPVIFAAAAAHNPHLPHVVQHPSAVHGGAPSAAYLNALATHTAAISPTENGVYSAEYFKALQNAVAAGVFQAVPHTHTTPVFPISPLANSGSNNSTSPATISMPKTRLRSPATGSIPTQAPIVSPPAKSEQRNATTTKLSTGTYLYEKAKRSPPDTPSDTEKFFKIPSGKEGSLKHRILTRPLSTEKTPETTAVTTASTTLSTDSSKTPVMCTHTSTSSFKKGSYIELSNGSLRRVEDMRTEDFIQCAERSPHHQLIESTVVKINTSPSSPTVVIAFSYDRNHSKVDMEVATEYPFFVYGQGWASCNPELSYKAFGLKCQRLQVGDICISLTKRDAPNIQINNNNNNISNSNINNNNNSKPTYIHDPKSTTTVTTTTNETHVAERDLQTLILSESVYATHLKSAGMCPPPPTHPQYQLLRSPHAGTVHFMPPPTHLLANAPPTPEAYAHFVFPTPPQQKTQTLSTTATSNLHNSRMQHNSGLTLTPPTNSSNSTRPTDACEQSAAAAASARKRRWSAPESFSNSEDDDDEDAHAADYQPPLRQKSAPTAAVSSNYKPYLPAANMRLPASGQLYCDFSTNYK